MAIINTSVEKESKDRYLTYALSVVSSRALPDVRDGLKPVQRRILYDMFHNLNLLPEHSHRKSAAVVGGVLARFHPHGDSACYEAMVRMAQDFSLRYPLIDGQGNFGSLDGDNAAAYRYTEVRLQALALQVMGEIGEETVNFRDNFDGTTKEPIVLPSRIPNLLVNGAMGIAVGMATSIPPHNLRDTIKALVELLEDPEISVSKLVSLIKGPDFPTGCAVLNSKKELDQLYETGRGSIRMRGEWELEDQGRGKQAIVVTTIPYSIDKSTLVEKIASLIIEKKVPQLSDVRDESTDKVRIVLELSSGANPELAMAYLFKNTSLELNFPVNLTALVPTSDGHNCRPEQLSLKKMLQCFLDFRAEIVQKRLEFEKKKLLERLHILEGLLLIYDALDEALKIVRKSSGRQDAAEKLSKRFKTTEIQSLAFVDMRIYQISNTSIDEISSEHTDKRKRVTEIDEILSSKRRIKGIVKRELEEVAEKFGDKRRSQLLKDDTQIEFNEENYIVDEDVFAIVTKDGWIKRIRQNNELASTRLREGDTITRAHALSTRDSVVFLTNKGTLFSLKVADFPASSGYGDPIQKSLKFQDGEAIVESFAVRVKEPAQASLLPNNTPELKEGDSLILVSEQGMGYKTKLEGFSVLKRSGKRVMKLREGDLLAAVVRPSARIALFTKNGYALSLDSKEIPEREGSSVGVILIGVGEGDALVSALPITPKMEFEVCFASGGTKKLSASEVEQGHRALKGKRVIARGEIAHVRS